MSSFLLVLNRVYRLEEIQSVTLVFRSTPHADWALRQIKTCRQVTLLVIFKDRHLGFGVFTDIWPMEGAIDISNKIWVFSSKFLILVHVV